jgi:hypothetical protein
MVRCRVWVTRVGGGGETAGWAEVVSLPQKGDSITIVLDQGGTMTVVVESVRPAHGGPADADVIGHEAGTV